MPPAACSRQRIIDSAWVGVFARSVIEKILEATSHEAEIVRLPTAYH